jgi:long-chain fatty acid transport protein
MKRSGRGVLGLGVTALICAAWPRAAHAAGFSLQHFGGEHGNVVETNPLALYYNPAGIAFSEGIHLYLDGEVAMRSETWDHPQPVKGTLDQPNGPVGNGGHASLFNVFGGPAMGATWKMNDSFAIGAGLFVPFGGRVHWDKNPQFQSSYPQVTGPSGQLQDASCTDTAVPACPEAMDGPQRWHMIDASLTFAQATVGAAYKLGPLAIGAAGNLIVSNLTTSQAHSLVGSIDSTVEERINLDVSGINASFGAGAMLEAIPDMLWIGVSYQAQPGLGPQTLTGTLDYAQGPAPYYGQVGNVTKNVEFHQALPDVFRAGVRFRPTSDLELRLFGDYTRWSVMQSQCVNDAAYPGQCKVYPNGGDATISASNPGSVLANLKRNWKDTYAGRLGGSYWLNHDVELFAGVGYETAAVPDSTLEPGAADANNILLALGGRFFLFNSFYLGASYTQLQFMSRDNSSSQLASLDGTAGPNCPSGGPPCVQQPTFTQDGNGHYTQWVGVFDVNVEKSF